MSSSDRRPPYSPTRVELAKNKSLSLSLNSVERVAIVYRSWFFLLLLPIDRRVRRKNQLPKSMKNLLNPVGDWGGKPTWSFDENPPSPNWRLGRKTERSNKSKNETFYQWPRLTNSKQDPSISRPGVYCRTHLQPSALLNLSKNDVKKLRLSSF